MILLYDTETTGLPFGKPHTAPDYPKIVQIAWVCLDHELKTIGVQQMLLDPGVSIPVQASNVHGITDELVQMAGTHSKLGMRAFLWAASKAEIVVGHNVKFDDGMVAHECWRHGMFDTDTYRNFASSPRVDTMSRRLLRIPPGKSDRIKLEEAHKHVCDTPFEAHNALEDTLACLKLFKHAVQLGTIDIDKLREQSAAALEGA